MEDYEGAFLQRVDDVTVLDENKRRIAAIHFGGVAVECLLKHILFTSLPDDVKKEWKTQDYDPGHTLTNPGHNYQEALNRHNRLRSRLQQAPHVLAWLNDVEYPDGHFIDMRYSGNEPNDEKYRQWVKSYRSLINWLLIYATRKTK